MADDTQQQDPENLQGQNRQDGSDAEAGRSNPPDSLDDTYEPSTVQVNNGRIQGLGVGQKDIDYQRDPTRIPSADRYGR